MTLWPSFIHNYIRERQARASARHLANIGPARRRALVAAKTAELRANIAAGIVCPPLDRREAGAVNRTRRHQNA